MLTTTGMSRACQTTVGVPGHPERPSQSRANKAIPAAKARMRTDSVMTRAVPVPPPRASSTKP